MNKCFKGILIKNRVWVPKDLHNYMQNNFCEFNVKQKKRKISFISKLNKDGRLIIPKSFNKIKKGQIYVTFRIIKNSFRPSIFLKKSEIDLLGLIPKKTLSGFEILAVNKGNKIFVWYFASKGRPKEILIKRYVNKEFCRLLGYYRAEGGKPRISKRRGREFSFTNKSLKIISDFIEVFAVFSDKKILKASIRYNPSKIKEISRVKEALINLGLNSYSITSGEGNHIKNFVVRIYVTNSLLSEIIDNAEKIMRNSIINNSHFYTEYLKGVIEGDGSIYSWVDKKGSLHSRLQIFESNEIALDAIKKMLEFSGIYGNIKKSDKKMFIYTAYLNWNNLIFLYENKFSSVKSQTLKFSIKKHKRFRSMKHLLYLPKKFNTSEFRLLSQKSYGYSVSWLKDRENEGLIRRIEKENNQNLWQLEDSAIHLASVIRGIEK